MSSGEQPKNPVLSANWWPSAMAGILIIFGTFGIAGGWSAVARIDHAIIAPGVVAVETNRKVIQHFEGGIIREVLVREGDNVVRGQTLLRLQQTKAQASAEVLRAQLLTNKAVEARLETERTGKAYIDWPNEIIAASKKNPAVKEVIDDQVNQFKERRSSLLGQLSVLGSRIQQLGNEISGVKTDRAAMKKQVALISEELVGLRELYKENLVTINRLHSMERERARLNGKIGRSIADEAKAQGQVDELKLQSQQLKQKFNEEVATQLSETRQKTNEIKERLIVAEDVLSRVDLNAPRAGTIQNLKVFTIGQVIRSGEPLMEIVPRGDSLVVHARFSPVDIDAIESGREVEIRFPAFQSRTLPVMLGTLESLSNDRITDQKNQEAYFLGVISIARARIPSEYKNRLRSGMPAEVIASVGERTVMDYMVQPLTNALRKTFREK